MLTYIPKRPCKNCGTSLRYRSNYGCAECLRKSNRSYQLKNRDALLPKKRAWAKANPEKNAAQSIRWQRENKESAYAAQRAAKSARWEEHYRAKYRHYGAKRRAALIDRTPAWADMTAIERVYRDCPRGMEVDHIVPLLGRTVSGLHVAWNLQYLTKSENAAKGNKHG